ncbi:MAG: hypothetical protein AB1779_04345 [Candidatus Thermoplasmatota archaeon]
MSQKILCSLVVVWLVTLSSISFLPYFSEGKKITVFGDGKPENEIVFPVDGGYDNKTSLKISKDAKVLNATMEFSGLPVVIEKEIVHTTFEDFSAQQIEDLDVTNVEGGELRLKAIKGVIKREKEEDYKNDTFFSVSLREGVRLSKETTFDKFGSIFMGSENEYAKQGSIAADKNDTNKLHIVYLYKNLTNSNQWDVFYANSTDKGETIGGIVNITNETWEKTEANGSINQTSPKIAISQNGEIHIIWVQGNDTANETTYTHIYYSVSKDNGTTFSTPIRVNDNITYAYRGNASIAVDSNNTVHVVWEDNRTENYRIYYAKKKADENKFSASVWAGKEETEKGQYSPTIAVTSDNRIHVVWTEMRTDHTDIVYSNSSDGNEFVGGITVNDDGGTNNQSQPSIGTYGNEIYIAWIDFRKLVAGNATGLVYFARSTNGGLSFHENIWIDGDLNLTNKTSPSLSVDVFGTIHVGWIDMRHDTMHEGNTSVYYTYSSDGIKFAHTFDQAKSRLDKPGWLGKKIHFSPICGFGLNKTFYISWDEVDENGNSSSLFASGKVAYSYFGELTSPVIDFKKPPSAFERAVWFADIPNNTAIALKFRTSSKSPDSLEFEGWTESGNIGANDTAIGLEPQRYFSFSFTLTTQNDSITPTLYNFTLYYTTYLQSGRITSVLLDTGTPISSVIVDWNATLLGGNIIVEVTIDNGTIWQKPSKNFTLSFPMPDTRLRYRITFQTSLKTSPILTEIRLRYSTNMYPTDVSLDVGADGLIEWNYIGIVKKIVLIEGIEKALNDYIISHQFDADEEGNITIPLSFYSKSLGKAKLSALFITINSQPLFTKLSPKEDETTIKEGDEIIFSALAFDDDGDRLIYTWLVNSEIWAYGEEKTQFTFQTNRTSSGNYTIKVEVKDGYFTINHTWKLNVIDLNRPPTITSIFPQTSTFSMEEGKTQEFKITYEDLDNDPISIVWYLDGTHIFANDNLVSFVYKPGYDVSSGPPVIHTVSVVVSDGVYSADFNWTVTVTNVDQRPEIKQYSPTTLAISLRVGEKQVFTIVAEDPDSPQLEYRWYKDEELVYKDSTTYTFSSKKPGVYVIKIVVADKTNSDMRTWTVTVKEVTPPDKVDKGLPWLTGMALLALIGGIVIAIVIGIIVAVLLLGRPKYAPKYRPPRPPGYAPVKPPKKPGVKAPPMRRQPPLPRKRTGDTGRYV